MRRREDGREVRRRLALFQGLGERVLRRRMALRALERRERRGTRGLRARVESLDAPVARLTAPDTPVPFSPPLERAFIPQVEDVVAGLRELAEY